ncbi:hypothetical protein V6N13_129406 [Hibiscus sabdariffa]|uniref:Uncharacterized protein n=1 Tax=Hibiscus sabdariffa TaxID=183260 RepID=A0ABR2SLC7_9ROSI
MKVLNIFVFSVAMQGEFGLSFVLNVETGGRSGIWVLTSKTWTRLERSGEAKRRTSKRKEREETMLEKEDMVDEGKMSSLERESKEKRETKGSRQ